jgi:putative nucleotidyltransferase with HDIG domain
MGVVGEFGSVRHLVTRFLGALSPAGPPPSDEAWALGQLLTGEQALWRKMSGPDRRHALAVARRVVDALLAMGIEPSREVVACALLHDVGKIEADLGTFARVAATLAALAVGRERLAGSLRAAEGRRRSLRARLSLYLSHDRVGAELLRAAQSAPTTIAWAEEHHLPPQRWSLERRVGEVLKAADGD